MTKRFRLFVAFSAALTLLVASVAQSTWVAADKPQPVIALSNGYPSGAHFNLNIHGKKSDFSCDSTTTGGGSVFVPEYGTGTITFVSNRKASLTGLTALDPCAEAYDRDPIKVQIPTESEGYWVFARIKGKPSNGSNSEPSTIVLTPNPIIRACNDTDPSNPDFSGYDTCPADGDVLLALGLVTAEGAFQLDSAGFLRFDPNSAPGKGKNNAVDITGLFVWSGYACTDALDVSGPAGVPDGVLDLYDVPASFDADEPADGIQADEWAAFLAYQVSVLACTYYSPQWVFNIADLVEEDVTVDNDGTKLLQVRFYPKATTTYIVPQ